MQGKLGGLKKLAERISAVGRTDWNGAHQPVDGSNGVIFNTPAQAADTLQLASWSEAASGGAGWRNGAARTLRTDRAAVLPVRSDDRAEETAYVGTPPAQRTGNHVAGQLASETLVMDTRGTATLLNRPHENESRSREREGAATVQVSPVHHQQHPHPHRQPGPNPAFNGAQAGTFQTTRSKTFFTLPSLGADDVAVDLGTTTTLVWSPRDGIVLDEPSVVAVQVSGGTREVLAVGQQAKSMLGRTPDSIETIRPLRDGVVADFIAAEEMMRQFIGRAKSRLALRRPRVLVCVPAGSTPVERRAVYESTLAAGARSCMLVEEPVAAALGAGLPIYEPQGSMIVDIGGGTTDVAVMSLGGVLEAHSMRVAGHAMDNAIIKFIRRHHNLLIGEPNAERIKIEVGSAAFQANGHDVDVQIKGRDMRRGLPTEITLGPEDIAHALSEPLEDIAYGVQRTLERMPPELASDICDRGICLTGGGAMLERIDEELSRLVGVRAYREENPRLSVIEGCGMILGDLERFKNLLIKVD